MATLLLIASFLIGPALTGSLIRKSTTDKAKPNMLITVLTMIGILAIPFLYSDSLRRSTEEALAESLSSQRYYKSLQEAELLSTLAPSAKVLEIPVARLKTELAQQVTMLETSLSAGLSSTPRSVAHAGQQVTALMQLDRNQEALKLLKEISSQEAAPPQVLDFSGLCCQRLSRWEESRDWYRQSRQFWATQPESSMQRQALISAYKGIAFAERQLENSSAAEQAYLSVLKLEPNADIHFLLARLYDQQERTTEAREHATLAMTLNPARYGQEAQSLLRRASLSHFGCSQFVTPLHFN
ncbi:tetratricopeptide repeat protein [Planctomicrobium sp. SH527]|uniref:tetratricopeptide repeat protein n=1 Tax=Planctomicrobium sp. SH527 TaxID=3448123 RepID=UPI003F5C1794